MKIIEENFFLIFKYMGIPKEQIRMEASFANDFGFEEFQFACLVFTSGVTSKLTSGQWIMPNLIRLAMR